MPAIGIHPVRAAMKIRNSDVSSGGSESSITETPRMDADRTLVGRQGQQRGIGGTFGNEIGDRTVEEQRAAEIQPHRTAQPVAVLRGNGLVETKARARLLDRLPSRFDAE